MIDSAPDTLNTLNELAAALGDDPNFATTISTQIGNKVDKIDGKGLSTNDFTDAYKAKVDSALQSYTETDPTVPAWAKTDTKPVYTYAEITDKPTFSTVATSGNYNDLSNKPAIPSIDGLATETYVNNQVSSHTSNTSNPHGVTKAQIGLGNVDNTSDLNKPISNATQTALNTKANNADLGTLANKSIVEKTDLAEGVQESLNKADTALQLYEETDPTVPAWAKAETKPTYTAEEVGVVFATIDDIRAIF